MFSKGNEVNPFLDATPLEFFSQKNDASLFMFGCHQKKRPNHLILGRFFDHRLMNMIELSIQNYVPASEFKSKGCGIGQRPIMVFHGPQFETDEKYQQLRSLFLDLYAGTTMTNVSLNGLEYMISITIDPDNENLIHFRVYNIYLKKSGTRVPRIELQEMGPRFDFQLGRIHLPDQNMMKQAMRVPNEFHVVKKKNVSRDALGDKYGRVHMGQQDLSSMQTRKMKGLKRKRTATNDTAKVDFEKKTRSEE